MNILRSSFLVISLVALLALLKVILDIYSPVSAGFHNLLVFDYQLLLLGWMIAVILALSFSKSKRLRLKYPLIFMLVVLPACDLLCYEMMQHPHAIPSFCKKTFRDYYNAYERNIIQYDHDSEYDSAFFYRLRPYRFYI